MGKSTNTNSRDVVAQIEFIYNAVNLLFTWTSLANFYLAFFFVGIFMLNSSAISLIPLILF